MEHQANLGTKRWHFSLSLRLAMLLILVLAVLMGRAVNQAHCQGRVVALIKRANGKVYYDYEIASNGSIIKNAKPWGPSWITNLLGDDYFRDVVRVEMRQDWHNFGRDEFMFEDEEFAQMRCLRRLRYLDLANAALTEEGRATLESFDRLEVLYLGSGYVDFQPGDAALEHVGRLRRLRLLELNYSLVTDAGLAQLKGLDHLERLFLDDDQITNVGLTHLKGLRNLKILSLCNTKVSDAGLANLGEFPRLQMLGISGLVSDAAIAALKKKRPDISLMTCQ